MSSVQKAIFPGIILASLVIILFTRLISDPREAVQASSEGSTPVAPAEAPQISSNCSIGKRFPETVRQWCSMTEIASAQYGLDPNLIAALILQESGGNPDAYSRSGAVGLMQVMPRDGIAAQFMCINGPCFASRPTSTELYDPQFNIDYGVAMLAGLINKTGDVREALRLYGPMDAGYTYADKVLSIADRYR
jgi:soluble lytic murein transglycosylase-like protein